VVITTILGLCYVVYATFDSSSKGCCTSKHTTGCCNCCCNCCCSCKLILAEFPVDKLRIPVVVFQIVTQFVGTTGQPLPESYQKFLGWTDAFNFNPGWLLSLSCVTKINFHRRFLVTTISPIGVAFILGCISAVANYKLKMHKFRKESDDVSQQAPDGKTARLERLKNRLYSVFLTHISDLLHSVNDSAADICM
jgi:hypothetical protein